jgi:hypothetical protein
MGSNQSLFIDGLGGVKLDPAKFNRKMLDGLGPSSLPATVVGQEISCGGK